MLYSSNNSIQLETKNSKITFFGSLVRKSQKKMYLKQNNNSIQINRFVSFLDVVIVVAIIEMFVLFFKKKTTTTKK